MNFQFNEELNFTLIYLFNLDCLNAGGEYNDNLQINSRKFTEKLFTGTEGNVNKLALIKIKYIFITICFLYSNASDCPLLTYL